jgi:hypothetical protein
MFVTENESKIHQRPEEAVRSRLEVQGTQGSDSMHKRRSTFDDDMCMFATVRARRYFTLQKIYKGIAKHKLNAPTNSSDPIF